MHHHLKNLLDRPGSVFDLDNDYKCQVQIECQIETDGPGG